MNEDPMTHDDELAELLALDALEPDEQADAEMRHGTWPMPLAAATVPLAEVVAVDPPDDLAAAVLATALARRPAGSPVEPPAEIAAAVAFERAIAQFHALVTELDDTQAELPAHEDHGRVRDLVAHLAGIETLNRRWIEADAGVPDLPDHVASTRETVADLAARSWADVVEAWYDAATTMLAAARNGDGTRQVRFHDLVVSVDGMLTMRTFELWAHGMDIALATDRPLPVIDDERIALMSSRLMNALPGALAYRGVSVPDRTIRFVLTGPAGGCYDVPLGNDASDSASTTVVADVVDLCRVAAARLTPSELSCTVEGDRELADLVLANIDAFARD